MRIDTERSLALINENEIRENTLFVHRVSYYLSFAFIILAIVLWIFFFNKIKFSGWYGTVALVGAIFLNMFAKLTPEYRAKQKNIDAILSSVPKFHCTGMFVDKDLTKVMAIDERRKILCLLDAENRFFMCKDILGVAVTVNGLKTKSKLRTNCQGKTLIERNLSGLGADFWTNPSNEEEHDNSPIKSACLKILINDTDNSIFEFHFLHEKSQSVSRTEHLAKRILELLNKWFGHICYFIEHADKEESYGDLK
ncbi:hypothetical protein [Paenibacillus elgii]|uniref:hypothetical protein n=1 Tax=Paenibacillus elgii TaxID=189691 RepID=UPI00203C87C1|nr:hypothetical protein [Paenibacillus elgii]